jgi:hypothetical protein
MRAKLTLLFSSLSSAGRFNDGSGGAAAEEVANVAHCGASPNAKPGPQVVGVASSKVEIAG